MCRSRRLFSGFARHLRPSPTMFCPCEDNGIDANTRIHHVCVVRKFTVISAVQALETLCLRNDANGRDAPLWRCPPGPPRISPRLNALGNDELSTAWPPRPACAGG